ncbi:FMRFamide-activated amiloride-sensitive sodium channel-like [Lineus longissimus]|uniref:FMRFamide-activated amiloride-sensitive sodium channel-like n=1 Tax=Lineus longissimus TaxID=88925 RepID=UPI002B4E5D72
MEKEKSLAEATLHLASSTSLHGPSHVIAKKSLYGKLLWMAVMLTAFGMLIWQFTTMINKFYTYPVSTSTAMENNPHLYFPAVTFCNVNPVRRSMMDRLSEGMQGIMQTSNKRPPDINGADFNAPKADMQTQSDFYQLYSLIPPSEKKEVGHQLDYMLVDCMWNGRQCSGENFTWFTNWKYGNCFTFNQGVSRSTQISRNSGPLYGLHLQLYIQESEYVSDITPSQGIKVVIHNQTDMPFPEDSGFFIPPGQETAVGLKLTTIAREDPPHGKCENVSSRVLRRKNAYMNHAKNLGYTHKTCQQTCIQQRIIEACNCSSYMHPNVGPPFETLKASGYSLEICNETGTAYDQYCTEQATNNNAKSCQHYNPGPCPVQCLENLYKTTISSMQWPSEDNLIQIIDNLLGMAVEINDTGMIKNILKYKNPKSPGGEGTPENQMAFIRRNVIVLNIYYEDFYVQTFVTSASYGIGDLLSSLGGTFGLWMGLSIITVFEFVEFFIDLIRLAIVDRILKNKKRSSDMPSKSDGQNDVSHISPPNLYHRDDIELTKKNYITPISGD